MQDYKRGSHMIWDCKYHLVWVTKCRYPILVGDGGQREDPSSAVCGESGSVLEGEEFAQAPFGISSASETLLGSTSIGARLLGGIERQRHL